jgi:ABC-type transport system substrate-binding protein
MSRGAILQAKPLSLVLMLGAFTLLGFLNTGPAWAASTTGPHGELVMLVDNLGGEFWANDVGSMSDADKCLTLVTDNLVRAGLEGEDPSVIYPNLAERWEMSKDGLTWDFFLRKGIRFQDGWGEMTAEDVKFSFEMIGRDGSTNPRSSVFRIGKGGSVKAYTVVDSHHFRVELVKPEVLYLWFLASYHSQIISKKYHEKVGYDQASKHPIGTGCWKMVEHKVAEYIKFDAVENHWRKTPNFKFLTLKAIPESSARRAMAKTGQADVIFIDSEFADEVRDLGWKVKRRPFGTSVFMLFGGIVLPTREKYDPSCPWVPHQDEPADSDWNERALKVRKAIALAINKRVIIDKIFSAEGELIPLGQYPAKSPYNNPKWKPFPYDPVEAKRLLAEAGYADGFDKPIRMILTNLPWAPRGEKIGMAISMDLEAIGLKVKQEKLEYPVARSKWSSRDSAWDLFVFLSPRQPEPWVGPSIAYIHTKKFNFGPEDTELTRLVDACKNELDQEKRIKNTVALGDYLRDNVYDVGICESMPVYGLSPKVGDWPRALSLPSRSLGLEFATHGE